MHVKKASKFAHTVAAAGLIGGLGAYAVLLANARPEAIESYEATRAMIELVSRGLILPSLALAFFTGLISMVIHRPFLELRWVWVKFLFGFVTLEGSLLILGHMTRDAISAARAVAAGEAPLEAVEATIANEWAGLGAILALSLLQVVLGVWRPRLKSAEQSRMLAALDARSKAEG